ncbi:hypothetical protein [Paraburkholderia caballeronis]|nr:hypothetical protein [Paraburkholderia caballeronis]
MKPRAREFHDARLIRQEVVALCIGTIVIDVMPLSRAAVST